MMNLVSSWAEQRRSVGIATSVIAPIVLRPTGRPRLAPQPSVNEADLARRHLAGDQGATGQLLRAYERHIRGIAVGMSRQCAMLDAADLAQVGRMALIEHVAQWCPAGGTLRGFMTTVMRRAMQLVIDQSEGTIRIPRGQHYAIRRALKAGGLSAKLAAIDRLRRVESMDEPMGEDDDRALLDRLSYGGTPEDALIAWEEMGGRERGPVWRPDRDGYEADDEGALAERLRVASRGRTVQR